MTDMMRFTITEEVKSWAQNSGMHCQTGKCKGKRAGHQTGLSTLSSFPYIKVIKILSANVKKKKKIKQLNPICASVKRIKGQKKKNAKVTSALPLSDGFLQKVIARYKGP